MSKTKERIKSIAKKLFNEQGIADITMRKIALAAGMSVGNLNYHFKKREEVLEALYFEMVEVFDKPLGKLEKLEFSLEKLYSTSLASYERMVDYKFIWIDLHQLLRENETIKKHFLEARLKRLFGYQFMLGKFSELGIIAKAQHEQEYLFISKRLINTVDYWIVSALLDTPVIDDTIIKLNHRIFMDSFYPYLTKKGKKDFKQLFE